MTSITDINPRQRQQQILLQKNQTFYHHQHEKSKGICELLMHSRTLPGGLVRRPVSFNQYKNKNIIKNTSTMIKLTVALDGSLFLNKHMNHQNIVPSIQTMIHHYQEHIRQVSIVLDKLLALQQQQQHPYECAIKATIVHHENQTQMEIILPCTLFSPHVPSIGRTKIWLRSILGMDPTMSNEGAFIISEHDQHAQPIDPAYFRELQLFLDQVDTMIGCSFGMMPSSQKQQKQRLLPPSS